MSMVSLPAFVVVTHNERTVNTAAMEAILQGMWPFVASLRQLPYSHFDHGAIGISRLALIYSFAGAMVAYYTIGPMRGNIKVNAG